LFENNKKSTKILVAKAISYLLNLLDHLINYDSFTYLGIVYQHAWARGQENNQNVHNENDNDIDDSYETFIIDINSSNL
jgi:hypothetical protein